jgi:hypothetical protein
MRFAYGIDPTKLPAHGNVPATEFRVSIFAIIGFIAFIYGMARAVHFHPGLVNWTRASRENKFANYLRTTPWNPSKRLPWGTPLLSVVDLVIVAAIALLALSESPSFVTSGQAVMFAPALFAAGYAGMSVGFPPSSIGSR